MSADAPESAVRIRAMEEEDLPAVMRIERQSYPYPWPALFFLRGLRSDWSCWVMESGGDVAGYGVMRLRRGRAHIRNVCVAPAHRGRGLGRKMLEHLLQAAAGEGVSCAWLEVRPDNVTAIRLYEDMGFRVERRHKRYYPSARGRTDALVMARSV